MIYVVLSLQSNNVFGSSVKPCCNLCELQAKNINLSSQVKDPFADDEWLAFGRKMEFKTNELVMLESLGRGHFMTVGGYRMV